MTRRAVITGLGIVSPIGVGVEAFWRSALAGRSGIGRPTLFDASKLAPECQIVGEVRDFNPRDWMPAPAAKMAGRFSQFAVAAARMALDDSGLDVANTFPPVQVSIGTSMSGLVDVEQPNFAEFIAGNPVAPWTVLEYSGHAAAGRIAMSTEARGQATTFTSACSAGLDAIAWASEKVIHGQATAVIAGGTDATLSAAAIEAFRLLGALSRWQGPPEQASRPFDRMRSGLVLGEGAGVVIIEEERAARDRGAHIYAVIRGTGSVTEGTHMRQIDTTGAATSQSIQLAMQRAAISPTDIDYVCAHGNSLVDYDAAETAGIKKALGSRAWSCCISSIKSMCGQPLAAGGPMQVVASCLVLRDGMVPPTINFEFRDPSCDLDYVPNYARHARVRTIVVHSQSIGGSHTALVLSQP